MDITAKQILEKYRSAFLYIDEHVIYGEIGSVYDAMKEIAELTWDECWSSTADGWNGEICPIPYQNDEDAKNYDINKNIFIKQLFGEEDI